MGIRKLEKNKKPKIYIASDHAGFELKEKISDYLIGLDFEVSDEGAFEYNKQDDYPDFISKVAKKVSENPEKARGIILGGSGQGEAIVANRFDGVRATVYYGGNEDIIRLSREHNDANVLSLGARFIKEEEAKRVLKTWLETEFSGEERHKRRIEKIDKLGEFDRWNGIKKILVSQIKSLFLKKGIYFILKLGKMLDMRKMVKGSHLGDLFWY